MFPHLHITKHVYFFSFFQTFCIAQRNGNGLFWVCNNFFFAMEFFFFKVIFLVVFKGVFVKDGGTLFNY